MSECKVEYINEDDLRDEPSFNPISDALTNTTPVVRVEALQHFSNCLHDRFTQYERGMLERGSGMTEDQRRGATIALRWMQEQLAHLTPKEQP